MAMTINELRGKRANLWENMKDFLETHRGENGCLSAEDDAAYARMEADMAAYGKEIDRLQRQAETDAALNMTIGAPLTGRPGSVSLGADKTGRASNAYREDFGAYLRVNTPVHNVLSTGTDADGGYLVPTEFESQIVTGLAEENVIRSIAKVITTTSERKIPVAATHSVAAWTAENAAMNASNPTFAQKSLDAHKLTDIVHVSTELMQDSAFDLEAYIADEFARAFAAAEEEAFCVGTGSGQPTGIFTANGGEVGLTAADSDKVTVDELLTLVYSLRSPYRRKANFLMNDNTVSALRKLKDGNGVYIWQPSLQAGEPDKLMGFTLQTSAYVPTMASGAYAIGFGDFSHYWIGDRATRTIKILNELYAANGQIGYLGTARVDGMVVLPEAIQLLKMKA